MNSPDVNREDQRVRVQLVENGGCVLARNVARKHASYMNNTQTDPLPIHACQGIRGIGAQVGRTLT